MDKIVTDFFHNFLDCPTSEQHGNLAKNYGIITDVLGFMKGFLAEQGQLITKLMACQL